MFRRFLFLAVICAPFALAGCGFEAPAPRRTPPPPTPVPPLSTLSLTLAIPAAQLARILNNMTEYRIADLKDQPVNCGIGRCRLNLTASRTGPVSVASDAGALTIKVPFAMKAELATSGFLSFLHAQGSGQGLATARASLAVSPDLQLHSSTAGTIVLDDGHLRVGPVVTNIAQVWNDNQESFARPLWRALDKQIAAIPLRQRVAALWINAFTPLSVGKVPVSWLVLRPERLDIAQPIIQDGAIGISLSIAARGRVVVQDQRPANSPTRLPRAGAMASPSNAFSFAVPLLLPYDRAAQLAMVSLARKPPRIGGMTVHFDWLQFLPSGRDVVVVAKLCADPRWDPLGWFASCGTLYLRGTPAFDPVRRTVSIVNLHYDIASANLMLKALRVLAGRPLAEDLQLHLVFDEATAITRLQSQITSALAKPQGRDLSISAQVQSFGQPSFTWTAEGFLVFFSAKGRVDAHLNL